MNLKFSTNRRKLADRPGTDRFNLGRGRPAHARSKGLRVSRGRAPDIASSKKRVSSEFAFPERVASITACTGIFRYFASSAWSGLAHGGWQDPSSGRRGSLHSAPAADHDGRIVTIGQLVLLSTDTGDAWLLDPSDHLAALPTPNQSASKKTIPPLQLTGRAAIASRDPHSFTSIEKPETSPPSTDTRRTS